MKIRKRAVRGYAESAVREELKLRQETHRLRMQGLNEELLMLQQDNGRLRRELEEFDPAEPAASSAPDEDPVQLMAKEKLLQMHIEQSVIVWEAMKQLDKLDKEHRLELEDKQRECNGLLERVERQMKGNFGAHAGKEVQNNEASE
ncbi:MAG TPA: hypothetical protein VL921_04950 [Candidatus Udaeobacter sp.]|nr:hypothetical protein [Candidatus Udaeobacter sp.]